MKALSIIALFATLTASAGWEINTITDPMTDKVSYSISTPGDPVDTGFFKYRPWLHFRITPVAYDRAKNLMSYTAETLFSIEGDGLRRGSTDAMIRFDKQPAKTVTVSTSTDRRAGFFEPGLKYLNAAESATNILIRYTTTLGAVRTTRFTVSGLHDQIQQVKRRHAASLK